MKGKDLYRMAAANIKADKEQIRERVLSGKESGKKIMPSRLPILVPLCSFALLLCISFIPYLFGVSPPPSVSVDPEDTISGAGVLVIDTSTVSDADLFILENPEEIKTRLSHTGGIKKGLIYNGRTLEGLYKTLDDQKRVSVHEKEKVGLNIFVGGGK